MSELFSRSPCIIFSTKFIVFAIIFVHGYFKSLTFQPEWPYSSFPVRRFRKVVIVWNFARRSYPDVAGRIGCVTVWMLLSAQFLGIPQTRNSWEFFDGGSHTLFKISGSFFSPPFVLLFFLIFLSIFKNTYFSNSLQYFFSFKCCCEISLKEKG